ncbi:MAG: 1,2-phenylacetyl-CoA epoxidase subunit PaaC [Acidimicrobiales bacterium]|jgi:ring-1,2-phenylacetyl-CoA epoxidase subunit PaaC
MSELSGAARDVILAFVDDEHLMGQQHTEWIGVAPFLEEDLAFASIGQDELGHAAMLLEALVGSDDADIDALAFYREASDWRSCALAEITLPEWGDTLVRHWLYDAAEELRWQLFQGSSVQLLADISVRALSEEQFHRRHGNALLDALLSVDDARDRIMASLHKLLPIALTMFDGAPGEANAIVEGVVSGSLASLQGDWQLRVDARFGSVDWGAVASDGVGTPAPSQRTQRHDDFAPLLARMLEVLDLDRTVTW